MQVVSYPEKVQPRLICPKKTLLAVASERKDLLIHPSSENGVLLSPTKLTSLH